MKRIFIILIIILNYLHGNSITIEKRFVNNGKTLKDTLSNIEYQFNGKRKLNWNEAINYCNKLSLDGKKDWRLPNKLELAYLYEIKNNFHNLYQNIWSSESDKNNKQNAYGLCFSRNKQFESWNKRYNNSTYVKCVRGAKFKSLKKIKITINNNLYNIVKEIKKVNNISYYNLFIKTYPDSSFVYDMKQLKQQIYKKEYQKVQKQNTIKDYINFIKNYQGATQAKNAWTNIYTLAYQQAKDKHTIQAYQDFIKTYPKAPQAKDAQNNIYNIAYQQAKYKNSIKAFVDFVDSYKNASQKKQAIENIYKLTKKENNISGYEWFLSKYSNDTQVKDAIKNIHKLAFAKAKEINSISSYNTFIISYPYASQVRDANDKAYNLESIKYKRMKKDDEKKARLLAVKIKKLTLQMKRKSNKDGYIIVKDRMIKLLTEQYEETDASLRYYESKEFTDFTNTFENVMSNISRKLGNIERYSSEILSTSKQGFEDAKADRAMSRYKSEEHTKWEKQMHLREKGYN